MKAAAPTTFAQLSFRRILSNRRSTLFPRKWDYPYQVDREYFQIERPGRNENVES